MGYKFNPLLGAGLDEVGAGSGGTTNPGGTDKQVQFNDGGSFGGDAGLTFDKTSDLLTVGGDINLDSGGTYSTTIQSVTPTANRTISFPDQTGTVGLVSGATGNIQFNDAGKLAGSGDFNVDLDWNNASTVFTGLRVNVTDTASAAGSKLLDLQVGGTSKARFDTSGRLNFSPSSGSSYIGISSGYKLTIASLDIELSGTFATYIRNGVCSNGPLGFSTGGSGDLFLVRDAADTLAQRRSTNAQTFRLYNTLTGSDVSASGNYERGFLQWNSNVLELGTEAGSGGGSEQPVRITAATLKLPNLPTYADNTAATSGGLVAGDVYKTSTGELRITV